MRSVPTTFTTYEKTVRGFRELILYVFTFRIKSLDFYLNEILDDEMFEEYSNVITKIDSPIGGELGEHFERIGDPQQPEVIIASPHTSLTPSPN